ncbi:phosphotransferase [uncultured Ruminococcus sp.]|uniref:phosphotransferase n=1 Tax=uncultured Ruminococcus sp. TaxID=165186 RepID=UPI0037DC0B0C
MSNTNYEILAQRSKKVIYKDGDTVLKVFDSDYSKADILNEALNQARIEETGLNVPKLLEVSKIDGKWAIRTEYIPGKTLAQLMEENPDKVDEYLDLFVNIQKEIFSKEAPLLNKIKDKFNRKISASRFDATTRYELHTRLDSMKNHKKICHGDFTPSNIIITPEGVSDLEKAGGASPSPTDQKNYYILDWSHVTQGNAAADAARTYMLFCLKGMDEIAEKYLNLFCEKTDTAKQYVQRWMPIVACTQSVKGKEEEQEFLERWVNVVEYE